MEMERNALKVFSELDELNEQSFAGALLDTPVKHGRLVSYGSYNDSSKFMRKCKI